MVPVGRVDPLSGGASSIRIALQAHKERAARRIVDVANEPVIAAAASIEEIALAYGFRVFGKATCEFACGSGHYSALQTKRDSPFGRVPRCSVPGEGYSAAMS